MSHIKDKANPAIDRVLIYAGDHGCYWREGGCGYTNAAEAGVFTREEAYRRAGHCGPEKHVELHDVPEDHVPTMASRLDALERENARLRSAKADTLAEIAGLKAAKERAEGLLNTPEIHDFTKAVALEAAHQRERWGTKSDSGKAAADWFWLVGYLAGKALHACIGGNSDKALHHVITTAAACCNWHSAITGGTDMRPGIEPPIGEFDALR